MPVPDGEVTDTATEPNAVPGGVTAEIEFEPTTVNDAAGTPPNVTAVTPKRLLPLIDTDVPPLIPPEDGDMKLIEGEAK